EYGMRAAAVGFSPYFGVTQWQSPAMLGLAPVAGVHGLSGVLVAVNALVYVVVHALVEAASGVRFRAVRHRGRLGSATRAGWPAHTPAMMDAGARAGANRRGGLLALGIGTLVAALLYGQGSL